MTLSEEELYESNCENEKVREKVRMFEIFREMGYNDVVLQ